MRLFKRSQKYQLPPVSPEVIEAHKEAVAVKREQIRKRPMFQELAENMLHRHKVNGFGEKLEATYQGRGLL